MKSIDEDMEFFPKEIKDDAALKNTKTMKN